MLESAFVVLLTSLHRVESPRHCRACAQMRVSVELKERRPRKTSNWRLPAAGNLSEQRVPVAGLSEDVAEAVSSKYPLLRASPLNLFFQAAFHWSHV